LEASSIAVGDAPSAVVAHQDAVGFLRSLPAGSVDVLVTDPAYSGMNARLKLGRGRIVGRYADKGTADGKWFGEFEDTAENYHAFLAACRHALHPERGHIYIMFDPFSILTLGALLREHFAVKNVVVWDKMTLGMGHYFRRRHELIVFATAGNTRKLSSRALPDVWRIGRITRATYATQKPVELFEAMLEASARPGFTVCDPFVGSGSAAIAALRRGCRFVGCDVAERAVDLARDRIARFLTEGVDPLQPKAARR